MDVEIRAMGHQPFLITNDIPAALTGYHIPGSRIMCGTAPFGIFLWQAIELNGFSWFYTMYDIRKDVNILVSAYTPVLVSRVVLKGSFNCGVNNIGQLPLEENQCTVFYSPFLNNTFQFKKAHQYIFIDICYPVHFMLHTLDLFPSLEDFQKKLRRLKPAFLTGKKVYADAQAVELIYRLVHAPYAPGVKKFHLDIMKEILFRILKQAAGTASVNNHFSINNIEKIYAAKDFIDAKLPEHFSIFQIAGHIGINQQKLKKGFKEIFGVGLYAYLQNEVLKIAKIEVEETARQIKEIARHAGYKNPNNFSAAFKKKYGVSPLDWKKQFNKQTNQSQ